VFNLIAKIKMLSSLALTGGKNLFCFFFFKNKKVLEGRQENGFQRSLNLSLQNKKRAI